ncbi:NAD(P)/FAD-dependent oxidoreductase [Rhodococcus sp. MEB041]|uniref:flavin-containing monooxygenase n=1 Tax=Rhodococcus sp. MEB041 TaxID=3040323 RepID=UPI00254C616A|nr:NAD(P)/FAD-dependent oxidoreductase [Rhodococcus sp. MEB041]
MTSTHSTPTHPTTSDFEQIRASLVAGLHKSPEEYREIYRRERDKRIRVDGVAQYQGAVDTYEGFADDPFMDVVPRAAIDEDVEVVIIGGGFGGLLAGARLRQQGCTDIRILDEGGDFGGAWYWNRYPGAMCDIESYIYLPLLDEVGYVPTMKYAKGPEIRAHAARIGRHFGLYEKATFHTRVESVEWDDDRAVWQIRTNRGDVLRASSIVIASGPLSKPKFPRIPGIEDFGGHVFHTSRWDFDYTGGDETGGMSGLADKRVGIVGTGATSLQAVPQLAESAGELVVIQRTPSTVDVRANRPTDPEWAESLQPGWQQDRMTNFITIVSGNAVSTDLVADGWTSIYERLTGRAVRPVAEQLGRRLSPAEKDEILELLDFKKMDEIRDRIEATVADPETAEALKPWYRLLCKRPGFHDEYLDTFNRPNVTLLDTMGQGIERIEKGAVVAGGRTVELDCLIFATGFEVGTQYTSRNGYDVVGRNGIRLSEKWQDGFSTFHGLHSAGFPNCYFMGRIQTGTSVNYMHTVNEQSKHIAYIYSAQKASGLGPLEASPLAEKEWRDEIIRSSKSSQAFYEECTPGYFNNEGKPGDANGLFSGGYGDGPLKFFDLLKNWREEGSLRGLDPIA